MASGEGDHIYIEVGPLYRETATRAENGGPIGQEGQQDRPSTGASSDAQRGDCSVGFV